jgi:hypothetical protein
MKHSVASAVHNVDYWNGRIAFQSPYYAIFVPFVNQAKNVFSYFLQLNLVETCLLHSYTSFSLFGGWSNVCHPLIAGNHLVQCLPSPWVANRGTLDKSLVLEVLFLSSLVLVYERRVEAVFSAV